MVEKKYWRCNICNDLHYGVLAPEKCPTCGAPRDKHEEIEKDKFNELLTIV